MSQGFFVLDFSWGVPFYPGSLHSGTVQFSTYCGSLFVLSASFSLLFYVFFCPALLVSGFVLFHILDGSLFLTVLSGRRRHGSQPVIE